MCLRTCFCSKINKIPKTHSKFKKNQKNISFLNQFQILKFLTIKFLWCNIYQISNDNINYVPKQNHSSWLFIQKILKKNQKKVKTQKHKNNSRIAIRLLSYHQNFFFCQRTELFIALLQLFIFCQFLYPQWCIIFLTLQKSKLIFHVSKFGSMLRITPTFLARMLRV